MLTDLPGPIADLLREPPPSSLVVEGPRRKFRDRLAALTDESLAGADSVRDPRAAAACRAGLWLRFDFFEEAHAISQDLPTTEGSYWHAILHRREPDPGNAKYWFRRVGRHPVFELLREAAARLAPERVESADALLDRTPWDPYAFVDLCENARAKGPSSLLELCLAVQWCEWDLLFEHCWRQMIGS
jgi:hypothetical protein